MGAAGIGLLVLMGLGMAVSSVMDDFEEQKEDLEDALLGNVSQEEEEEMEIVPLDEFIETSKGQPNV